MIWLVCPSPLGCCSVCALVIRPPRTVTSTWTGPYCVSTTPPATTTDAAVGGRALVVAWAVGRGEVLRFGVVDDGVVEAGVLDDEGGAVRLLPRLEGGEAVARPGRSDVTTAAEPVVVCGCTLARNATATTAVVATVINSLIPRLTHVLPSPRESLLVQLIGRQPDLERSRTHRVHPPVRPADIDVVLRDPGHEVPHGVHVGP